MFLESTLVHLYSVYFCVFASLGWLNLSCLRQSAIAVCLSIGWCNVSLWDINLPHTTCPRWDSCFTWGGRGTSFEALSKRDDILGSELKALAIISHEWMRAGTISSYSNFVLPWLNSAFWRADCFFMYSSKSSWPKPPISPRWASLISERFSISREDEAMWSVSLEGEVKKKPKRIFWDKSATEMNFLAQSI